MTVTTQIAWQMAHLRRVAELARIRADALRGVAVAAALQERCGIRAVRAGCYSIADLLLLRPAVQYDVGASVRKRAAELEADILPMSREDRITAAGMFGGAAQTVGA